MTHDHDDIREPRWIRSGAATLYDRADQLTILGGDGATRRLDGATAQLTRAVLDALDQPRTAAELERVLDETFDLASGGGRQLVADLLDQLRSWGAIARQPTPDERSAASAAQRDPSLRRRRVVLGVCGAVRAAFTPSLVGALHARGFDVHVVATESALRFVTPTAIEALTHRPLLSSMWQREKPGSVPHIDLSRWADLVIVAPASATTLSRLATGDFSCVVSAIALATRAPVVLCPSMNESMHASAAVRRNLAQLADDGFILVHPRHSVEVADAPHRRKPMMGGAPPAERIADIAQQLASELAPRADDSGTTVDEWNALFASDGPSPSWQVERIDDDLAQQLAAIRPPPARLLDVGSGNGTVAIEAARRGYQVVALDVSPAALDVARRRARARTRAAAGDHDDDHDARVTWLHGDITRCPISGPSFDVIVDRGCLHCLPPEAHPRYARAVADLLEDGGHVLLKVHEPRPDNPYRTWPLDADQLAALFAGAGLELASCQPSSLGPDAPALLVHLVHLVAAPPPPTSPSINVQSPDSPR